MVLFNFQCSCWESIYSVADTDVVFLAFETLLVVSSNCSYTCSALHKRWQVIWTNKVISNYLLQLPTLSVHWCYLVTWYNSALLLILVSIFCFMLLGVLLNCLLIMVCHSKKIFRTILLKGNLMCDWHPKLHYMIW